VTSPAEASVALFSYGTLQQPEVQLATFGRLLSGRADALPGYVLAPLAITDPRVVATSGADVHTIAHPSGDPADLISGIVYGLTPAELAAADGYEVDAYARVLVRLASGAEAFVYVGSEATRSSAGGSAALALRRKKGARAGGRPFQPGRPTCR